MEAVSVISGIRKSLYGPVKRHMSYLIHYDRNFKNLGKKIEALKAMENDVRNKVEEAIRRGEYINAVVMNWLVDVETTKEDIKNMVDRVNNNKRFMWWLRDLSSFYKLGKEAKKKQVTVDELEKKDMSNISHPAPPPSIYSSPPISDFQAFMSTLKSMNDVLEALKDDKIYIVCVHGTAGVGKTTLINGVRRQAKGENIFDEVVMVTVTQDLNVKRIQSEIAEQVGIELGENSHQSIRAAMLLERLKRTTRILIILDDLWARLELTEVGIPYGNHDHKGCKIVITTRSLNVCNLMDSQKCVDVNVLSDEDSWNLFKMKAGDVVESPTLQEVAMGVVKECGGLPLAIVTLGRALKNKPADIWRGALLQLRKSAPSNIPVVGKEVYGSIRLSYDYLESDTSRLCFLFCCLFPEDYNIDVEYLMRYAVGEGILKGYDTLEEAESTMCFIIDELKASGLLMEGRNEEYVRMHDVIRDFAKWTASGDQLHGFLARSGEGLTEWPEMEKLDYKSCKRISLMRNKISNLPEQLECPRLLTLILRENQNLETVPDGFFRGMNDLTVLDLNWTRISSFPTSLACLTNLRTLCLSNCRFGFIDVSSLGVLKKLEILDLRGCINMRVLPEEIGQLTSLKYLDLDLTPSLTIPPNVISRLSRLEQLYMLNSSFDDWEVEERGDGSKASLAELASLPRLTTLEVHVRSVECLSQNMVSGPFFEKLTKFSIAVGVGTYYSTSSRYKSMSCMTVGGGTNTFPYQLKVLVSRAWHLHLYKCEGIGNISQLSVDGGLNDLEELLIEYCNQVQCLNSAGQSAPKSFLEKLKKLTILYINELSEFCKGPLPDGFFSSLRFLYVEGCRIMVNVMPSDLLLRARDLEELRVYKCDGMQEVFQYEGDLEGQVLLSQLKELKLSRLPQLTSIWKGGIPRGSLRSFKMLSVSGCTSLRYLFCPELAQDLGQLETLVMYGCSQVEKIISRDETAVQANLRRNPSTSPPSGFFPNLRRLEIGQGDSLKSLFSWTLAQGLQQLEELTIVHCDQMNAVIVTSEEDDNNVVDMKCVLPRLKKLRLGELPMLTSFSIAGGGGVASFDWPALEYISVWKCRNMKKLPLGPQSSQKLRRIDLKPDDVWRKLHNINHTIDIRLTAEEHKEWIRALEWEDEQAKLRFEPLFEVD